MNTNQFLSNKWNFLQDIPAETETKLDWFISEMNKFEEFMNEIGLPLCSLNYYLYEDKLSIEFGFDGNQSEYFLKNQMLIKHYIFMNFPNDYPMLTVGDVKLDCYTNPANGSIEVSFELDTSTSNYRFPSAEFFHINDSLLGYSSSVKFYRSNEQKEGIF